MNLLKRKLEKNKNKNKTRERNDAYDDKVISFRIIYLKISFGLPLVMIYMH